ncbi:hypothetical protein PHLCEN_2v9864 [Hermanssonia centrifuga]|uniref:Uncharacterized protein n=1 Tax=Hermanssonia centrifuga TaxID=98765 RepID=A0A2R6NPM6_9APHY|nr:hypothetical protein PHLCEN_2v9864 [Hermanssonia centrifuga]
MLNDKEKLVDISVPLTTADGLKPVRAEDAPLPTPHPSTLHNPPPPTFHPMMPPSIISQTLPGKLISTFSGSSSSSPGHIGRRPID